MRKRSNRPEQRLQITICNTLKQILTASTWFCHIPNGGWRSPVEAGIFKAMGVRSGAPDILLIHKGQAYFMELKAGSGELTDNQRECHTALRAAGAPVIVVRTLDQALECLDVWGIPTRLAVAA